MKAATWALRLGLARAKRDSARLKTGQVCRLPLEVELEVPYATTRQGIPLRLAVWTMVASAEHTATREAREQRRGLSAGYLEALTRRALDRAVRQAVASRLALDVLAGLDEVQPEVQALAEAELAELGLGLTRLSVELTERTNSLAPDHASQEGRDSC